MVQIRNPPRWTEVDERFFRSLLLRRLAYRRYVERYEELDLVPTERIDLTEEDILREISDIGLVKLRENMYAKDADIGRDIRRYQAGRVDRPEGWLERAEKARSYTRISISLIRREERRRELEINRKFSETKGWAFVQAAREVLSVELRTTIWDRARFIRKMRKEARDRGLVPETTPAEQAPTVTNHAEG